ncbi:Si-specific NAD(P)(+) transhydrogenase [Devosia sp.]|jgi:NAD(P) transhydrogenase|uniref:Si-specific NAD(P)(+) transhydrogenase n=1 Tax=Devosia sp. TaxID=1871048 RepID=UPI0037C13850
MEKFDLIVIGSGPAGRRAAIQAAKLGKSVLVVENRLRVGGVSVHTGTIPSKTLRETVLNLSGWRERGFYGLAYRVKRDIEGKDLGARLRMTLDHEIDVLEHQFARNGVRTVAGKARFVNPHQLAVKHSEESESNFEAENVVIAVGTSPYRPKHIPFNETSVFDSDNIAADPRVPKSLTVVGAGVIGLEYATIYSAMDVPVTLVEPREQFLEFIDREIIEEFVHELRKRGMQLRLGVTVDAVDLDAQGWAVSTLSDGRKIRTEMLLYAAGRVGATAGLGLETCGIEADDRGRLKVDQKTFQTNVPNIYAAGDVIGFPSLASTAMEQGRIAACHAFGAPMPPAPEYFPYGIYAVPEISTVGLTEQQVKAKSIPYECGIARFRETSRGHIMGLQSGMMKLIFSLKTRRLLGAHIIGEGATELVHIGQAVLNLKGTVDYFVENAFNYPTLAEAYKIAALDAFNRMAPREPGKAASIEG